jgi:hypothetical protein
MPCIFPMYHDPCVDFCSRLKCRRHVVSVMQESKLLHKERIIYKKQNAANSFVLKKVPSDCHGYPNLDL